MNSMFLNVILRTIPRVNANEYEDAKLVGIFWGALMALRAILVYKYYFQLFKEEDIKKLDVQK